MYIANLTYLKPLLGVEKYLEEHIAFLDRYYEAGRFICSGGKNPRIGGVVLFHARDEAEVKQIIPGGPFRINGTASYEMIEFNPAKCTPDF